MRSLMGFITKRSLTSNNPGVVSRLCEISPMSLTYSKEIGYYTADLLPDWRLLSFHSYDDDTSQAIELTSDVSDLVIGVSDAIFNYASTHIRPYDSDDFIATIGAAYFGNITGLTFGEFVDNGLISLPSWFSFQHVDSDTKVVIWFSDEEFRDQYPLYSITVVPPIDNLDDFFNSYSNIVNQLNAITAASRMDRVQEAKADHPETIIRSLQFTYIPPVTGNANIVTTWDVLIYGLQGNDIDAVKDAIVEYVLANSTHTLEEWAKVFPDIFKRTEFVILPRWDLYSINNLANQAGLYRSAMIPSEAIEFAKTQLTFYTPEHVESYLTLVPHPYKTLALVIVAGSDNIESKKSFIDIFPDYLPISSTSLDFNRMTDFTRDWLIKISDMLIIAEKMTEITAIPRPLRRIKRNDKFYLSYVYDNVNYLIASGNNY